MVSALAGGVSSNDVGRSIRVVIRKKNFAFAVFAVFMADPFFMGSQNIRFSVFCSKCLTSHLYNGLSALCLLSFFVVDGLPVGLIRGI